MRVKQELARTLVAAWLLAAGSLQALGFNPGPTNGTSAGGWSAPATNGSSLASKSSGELDTAPSITSVHQQVWTASSSGSLDELSPEIISKLRQDVPFLAAYALRPRLVGAGLSSATAAPALASLEAPSLASGDEAAQNGLASAASAPRRLSSAQVAGPSSARLLGEFSQFDVEDSSLSKSEHHHKRKTSLKRQPNPSSGSESSASIIKLRAAQLASTTRSGPRGRKGAKRAQKSTRRTARKRASKLKRKAARKLARQEATGEPNQVRDSSKTSARADEEPGTKGGKRAKSPPFYAPGARSNSSAPTSSSGADDEPKSGVDPRDERAGAGAQTNELGDGASPEEAEIDDARAGEPRRVGDDDVEEDGDSVLVEPKSDGIDDDPPLPADEGDSDDGDDDEPVQGDTGEPGGRAQAARDDESRARRSGRAKPNEAGPGSGGAPAADANQQVAGAGIGATLGGSNAGGAGASGEDENEDEGSGLAFKESPGVEFAGGHERAGADRRPGSASGHEFGERHNKAGSTGASGGDHESELPAVAPKRTDSDAGLDSDLDDLDYRDEKESARREAGAAGKERAGDERAHRPALGEAGRQAPIGRDESELDGAKQHAGSKRTDSSNEDGRSSAPAEGRARGPDCEQAAGHDDGSYKPRDENYHEQHHQTSDWLRGSIPGEPDDDYPIFDRVTNQTNFRCSDQKHAGYYADVDSRCQIFHICQPDGRQDSFLCPNGTIFSQKSLVCVWWNGFDCEDAPKFYHLNELLYKSTRARDSPQAAALPNSDGDELRPSSGGGAASSLQPMKPRGMRADEAAADAEDEDDSSIESLLRSMRRREQASAGRKRGLEPLGDVDEASIQRKSITDEDNDAEVGAPARVRSLRNIIPRRKRRASARQAPPRLKSRRVSRNSRRRKLRHGIKPKRRA